MISEELIELKIKELRALLDEVDLKISEKQDEIDRIQNEELRELKQQQYNLGHKIHSLEETLKTFK